MICPSCNTANRDDAKFCKGCGQPLRAVEPAEESRPAQQVPAPEAPAATSTSPAQPESEVAVPAPDPSLEPTLILSPEKMLAYHARRWRAEEQQAQPGQFSGGAGDWSEAPTALSTPAPGMDETQQSISEMPTVPMAPSQGEDVPTVPTAPPPPPESVAAPLPSNHQTGGPADGEHEQGAPAYHMSNGGYPEVEATGEAGQQPIRPPEQDQQESPEEMASQADQVSRPAQADEAGQEETADASEAGEAGDQGKAGEEEQPAGQSEAANEFPLLAVGATVVGRYEVTQVIDDGQQEHVYQVVDHQGYQRCWNCGSEQNSEGDEFCIECGASLLNAAYIMHEYSAQPTAEDAPVLQGAIVNTFVEQGHTYAIEQVQAEQSAFPNGVYLQAATASDAGNVRRSDPNEDSTLVLQIQRVHESISSPAAVFIVADGMGGHDNGQGASRLAIDIIAERVTRELLLAPLTAEKNGEAVKPFDEDTLVSLLHDAVEDANNALCQKNAQEKSDMGSTVTGVMVVGDHAYIVNVGDSRTYMVRGQQLYQLTTDHSLVAQLVASGMIEPDDVYTHPQRSQIFRSLGDKPNVQIDIFKQQLHPGDILLSCCDGLWEMVRNPQIETILNNAPDPQTACAQLIDAANAGGGEDNISAVVVFVR